MARDWFIDIPDGMADADPLVLPILTTLAG